MPLGASRLNSLSYFIETAVTRTPKTITVNGDAQIDTAVKQFGTGSVLFDGSGDYINTNSSDFAFGSSNDFTIEGWYYINTGGNRGVFHLHNSTWPSAVSGIAFAPRTDINGFVVYHGSNTSAIYPATGPQTSTWTHWAITRESGTMNIYVAGDRIKTRSDTYDYQFEYLGIGGYYSTSYLWNGHVDEFRISTTARYTGASYTVPSAAFTNDEDTVLLIHGDGSDGSTSITDDGGS